MNICTNNLTPNHGLNATKQATQESGDSQKDFQFCPKCGSTNLLSGVGRKPKEISLKCSECKVFVGYKSLEKFKSLRRRKKLTSCLELLEKQGVVGDSAIFVLSSLGGAE